MDKIYRSEKALFSYFISIFAGISLLLSFLVLYFVLIDIVTLLPLIIIPFALLFTLIAVSHFLMEYKMKGSMLVLKGLDLSGGMKIVEYRVHYQDIIKVDYNKTYNPKKEKIIQKMLITGHVQNNVCIETTQRISDLFGNWKISYIISQKTVKNSLENCDRESLTRKNE